MSSRSPSPGDGTKEKVESRRAKTEDNAAGEEEEEEDEYGERVDDDDNDDEEEEEEDEEEDDEEDQGRSGKKRKRRRQGVNRFVDVEAVVDDDEEEFDDEDTELLKEDGFIEQDEGTNDDIYQRKTAAENQMLDLRRRREEEMDAEKIAAELRERYRNQRGLTARSDYAEVPQRMLMPSVNDPGLYAVRCRPGREKAVIQTLLRKAIRSAHTSGMQIISAFIRDSLPGRIYVEATEPKHVIEACNNVASAFARDNSLFLVPISEMADLLKITKSEQELKVGGWVRFKRGKYAGDLAQVLDFTENGETVGVKFVPRLDLDPRESNTFTDSQGRKRKKGATGVAALGERPPPRFFNAEEIAKIFKGERIDRKGKGVVVFRSKTYKDGYCEDDVRATALQTENVNPTLDEVSRFTGESVTSAASQGLGAGQKGVDLNLLADATRTKAEVMLRRDDHVEVFEGEQAGVEGVIDTVGADVVTIKLEFNDLEDQTIEVPIASVRKKFKPGDHIKVIAGKHQDETGLVVKVEDNVTTFLSDLSLSEISVFSKDIHEAAEVGSGVNTIGRYELHDLVQLDAQTAAVIFKIERDVFMVLDQAGVSRSIRPHQISMKRDSKEAVAVDSDGGEFRTGDSMKEMEGEEREGTVLHVYQSTLVWLFNRDLRDNAGVFLARARQLRPRAPRGVIKTDLSKQNPALSAAYKQSGASLGGALSNLRRPGGRDPLAGKTVSIIKGPYKTYRGIVKDTNGPTARVELHTMPKILTIAIDWLIEKDPITGKSKILTRPEAPRGAGSGGYMGGQSSYGNGYSQPSSGGGYGGATPGYGASARTPAHNPYVTGSNAAAGGKTPAYNPYVDGGKTPAYNPYTDGGKTPAYNPYADGGKTPAYNPYADGGRTPAYNPYVNDGGKTPAYNPYSSGSNGSSAARGSSGGMGPPSALKGNATPAYRSDGASDPRRRAADAYSAPTPMGAPTPGDFSAPTPGAYGSAPTPGVATGGYGSAATPGVMYGGAPTPGALTAPTPGGGMLGAPTPAAFGQTPYSSAPAARPYGARSAQEKPELLADIMIQIVPSPASGKSYSGGRYDGKNGSIQELEGWGGETVKILMDDRTVLTGVPAEFVDPLKPTASRTVCLVLAGEHRSKRFIVQSVDGDQVMGQLGGQNVFFDITQVARAA